MVWSAMESGQLAQGERVRQLEVEFGAYVGAPHVIATSSGTTAIFLTLAGLGIGDGDEVITVAFTFFASASPILHVGCQARYSSMWIPRRTRWIRPVSKPRSRPGRRQ